MTGLTRQARRRQARLMTGCSFTRLALEDLLSRAGWQVASGQEADVEPALIVVVLSGESGLPAGELLRLYSALARSALTCRVIVLTRLPADWLTRSLKKQDRSRFRDIRVFPPDIPLSALCRQISGAVSRAPAPLPDGIPVLTYSGLWSLLSAVHQIDVKAQALCAGRTAATVRNWRVLVLRTLRALMRARAFHREASWRRAG